MTRDIQAAPRSPEDPIKAGNHIICCSSLTLECVVFYSVAEQFQEERKPTAEVIRALARTK